MSNVPMKFTGGVDLADERARNVGYPIEDSDGVNKKYINDLGLAATSEVAYINVIDIISTDPSSPVTKTFKNGIFIESASTAAEDIKIKLRFGKTFSARTLPNVQTIYSATRINDFGEEGLEWDSLFTSGEMNEFNFTVAEQSLIKGDIKILELDYVQTFEFEYLVTDFDNGYYYFRNGGNIVEIEIESMPAPIIQSAEITSSYTAGQDELADGKTMTISITSDKGIKSIEVKGSTINYLTQKSENKSGNNTTETIDVTISGGPTGTDTAEKAYFQVRVQDEHGTWSNWYNSDTGSDTEGVDYLLVNNSLPVFGTMTLTYSEDPLTALNLYSEDNSEAIVTFTSVNYLGTGGQVVGTATGGSGLNVIKNNDTKFTMRAGIATYKYNTNTAQLTATRAQNGRTVIMDVKVNIASQDMVIGNISRNIFRSSATGETTTFNLTGTNQQVRARTLSLNQNISGLTLESQGTISGVNVNNVSMKVTDASVKGEYVDLLEVKLEGLSGREVTKNFNIISRGFVKRTLTGQDIEEPVEIPTVSNEEKLYVGIGDETTTGNGAEVKLYVHGGGIVPPQFSGADAGEAEFAVYYNNVEEKWFIVFDDNVLSEASSGVWLDNATIIIEEEI